MFDKIYSFKGTHADKVEKLKMEYDNYKHKLFERNLDVYLLAPIIGFLYQKKSEVDKTSESKSNTTKIFVEQLSDVIDDLMFNFRLIMLLDEKYEPDPNKRIDKAFRGNNTEEDMELYNQYVLGGVDILYEKLMDGVDNPEDYIVRLYEFLEDFDERYNDDISMDDVLKICRNITV